MSMQRFLVYTTAGTVLWTSLLAGAGWLLGESYEKVSAHLGPVSNVIVGGIMVWYIYRVATFGREQRRHEQERSVE